MGDKFSSKILLFGEYGVIKGSHGLAMPFRRFAGEFKKASSPEKIEKSLRLNDFCTYLEGSGILSKALDLKRFKKDIEQGLYFDSNIPYGHGVGSSGALCAGIFNEYSKDFTRKEEYSEDELKELQDHMALMESYYHGTSSGLDCLISLIDKSVMIEARNSLKVVPKPDLSCLGSFYLWESHIIRKTSPFVHKFLNKLENDDNFKEKFNTFAELTNQIIPSFINCEKEKFKDLFYEISRLQYLNFSEMIPEAMRSKWLKGLETRDFLVKLCGAGGGGFFLVYSTSKEILEDGDLIPLN